MFSRRALEALTAAITGAFGIAVIVQSLDNGIGWSTAGVESGTFPFMTGLIVAAGSLYNLARGWLRGREIIVDRVAFRRTLALFLPAAVFVAAIPLVGMYVASAGYLLATLRMQSGLAWLRALAIAILVAIGLYVVFEWSFQVALPHGLLGAWLEH
ncbi:MAG: tripartite tricarboxylate transporter TctB family protein [Reyranella sp.]|uniref:tripartite tricarboxylate transporter TctB family protein n=1 Tax=Reyranella sp. TaxID=1929291 RepID=UPI001AC5BDD5|nr:tripartite tricarboxylate transporter TctB family protein [Reyranella sp.]MBN9090927.1 tripartite tricarboxylate transporter TctB family protein [Reyranella sp.]